MLFELLGSLRAIAIAGGVAGAVGLAGGTYLGYTYRDARCLATIDQAALTQAHARVAALEANIKTMQKALDADAVKTAEDKAKLDEMERTANDLRSKTSGGVCLPAADVERLRQWWRGAPSNDPSRVRPR